MRIAICPGSFDPVTLGHMDVITRASPLFDKVIVAVMHNVNKRPMFTAEERVDFIRRLTQEMPNVEVAAFSGLLAEYARERGACAIVKGLRAVSDFESEFQMAMANRKMYSGVDTVFLTTSAQYMFLSSSMVKDIALHGGSISGFVPEQIEGDILDRIQDHIRKD
jgi:pantetheine-phosphate adenylyltransferase